VGWPTRTRPWATPQELSARESKFKRNSSSALPSTPDANGGSTAACAAQGSESPQVGSLGSCVVYLFICYFK